MSNIFQKIQLKQPDVSGFDLSHDHKLSLKMGKLVPFNCIEVLPGDKFSMSTEAMFRMNPMLAPIMHKVDIYVHHYFCPNRIIWSGWEKFITGGQDGDIAPAFPILDNDELGAVTTSSLADYLGIPLGDYTGVPTPISAMPFMVYQRIWADYYRDQNLEDLGNDALQLEDGVQGSLVMDLIKTLRDRAWEHDYFTSALPFAQKGDAVELPLDFTTDIAVKARVGLGFGQVVRDQDTGALLGSKDVVTDATGQVAVNAGATPAYIDPEDSMYIDSDDLSTTTTINDLRVAYQLQKWLELGARAGTRYFEQLRAFFGVKSPDARLQRPEYIGGSRASMAISEVLQTSSTDAASPQANMAGHGVSVTTGKDARYRCAEHGYIMSMLSIRPKTAYSQGLPRHFSKFDRLEYYFPQFAFLGEQEIKSKELYFDFTLPTSNENTFGYIPRYSEYRYIPSRISGDMKTSLNYWHMGREFDSVPTLNAEFIRCNPTKRIFAVEDPTEDEIIAHLYNKIYAVRKMPKYGTPGSI